MQYLKRGIAIKKGEKSMKTVLEVSLREAGKAQESINDNPALRVELEQVASDMWELPAYDENEEDEVEAHDQLMCDIDDQLKRCGIPTDEYWFNDINEEDLSYDYV